MYFNMLYIVAFLLHVALAGPSSGSVTFINATPYNWELTSHHSYQVDWKWPSVIKAGTSHEQYVKFNKDHHDDGAEATFKLAGSSSPASFIVKARPSKHIEVEFRETLFSLNNPANSVINLGWVENGAVSFSLSGNGDGPYISSNPPVAWMQATLSSIGSKTLREIVIPASHDAGMNKLTYRWGGRTHNTVTQEKNIFDQLKSGARSFDIRPVSYEGKFYAGHFSQFLKGMVGGTGCKLTDMVNDINSFNRQYPGELIILDISHQMNADKKFRDLRPRLWTKLFEDLNKIEALWIPSTSDIPDDISKLPLSAFIKPGSKSAVLIRLPNSAPLPGPVGHDKRSIAAASLATYSAETSPESGDGMVALGPALEGDDNSTSIEIVATSAPSVIPSTISDDDNGDNDHSTIDDSFDTAGDIEAPKSSPASMTLLPIPIETAAAIAEPIPAEVPVIAPATSVMAFFHASRFPISGAYADSDNPKKVIETQLARLADNRRSPHSDVHKSTWTITQRWKHITDVENKKTSVTADAAKAHKALFVNLWNKLTRETYPNWIEVDNIEDGKFTALCMAINDYFVSPRAERSNKTVLAKRSMEMTAGEKVIVDANMVVEPPKIPHPMPVDQLDMGDPGRVGFPFEG